MKSFTFTKNSSGKYSMQEIQQNEETNEEEEKDHYNNAYIAPK